MKKLRYLLIAIVFCAFGSFPHPLYSQDQSEYEWVLGVDMDIDVCHLFSLDADIVIFFDCLDPRDEEYYDILSFDGFQDSIIEFSSICADEIYEDEYMEILEDAYDYYDFTIRK